MTERPLFNLGQTKPELPVILAAEAAECGLASMAMVGRYHGHDIDLNGLRQRFSMSMNGASFKTLISLAETLSLASRALRVELEGLRHVETPAILHWDLQHFVVLKSVKGDKVTIHDPATGARTLLLKEVSRHFTGVVLEFSPMADFEPVEARAPVRLTSLWSKMRGFWPSFLQILGLSIALQVVTFAAPFQMQLVIDEGVARSDGNFLAVLAVGFGALAVVQACIEGLRAWALLYFGQMLSFQMIGNIFRHLLRLPSDYFEKRHVGDILSRISSAGAIQDVLTRGVIASIIDGVMAVVAVLIMSLYSVQLTFIVVSAVVLNAAIAAALFPTMRAQMEEQLTVRAREQSHLMETVRAASIVKLMGREAEREGAWRNLFTSSVNAGISVGRFTISLTLVQAVITGVQTVAVTYLGARAIINGDGFSIGMLFAFLSFRQTFTDRANNLVTQFIQFRTVGLHLERLADMVTTPSETHGLIPTDVDVQGRISFRGVAFRYGNGDPWIFRNLDLDIAPGQFLAITGASGGGKTTLMKLLLGVLAPSEGAILLDGNVATPELWKGWRERVGVVSQDDRLLSGTIAENIAFFDPDLDMARVQTAAEAACIHRDIVAKPMGYMSLVGDMGSSLSGGQKQRVLLARALYRQPKVLFLDEGTANLDEDTEEIIARLIESLPITRIIVAHRPALLRRASHLAVLGEQGLSVSQVVANGRSTEAAASSGPSAATP